MDREYLQNELNKIISRKQKHYTADDFKLHYELYYKKHTKKHKYEDLIIFVEEMAELSFEILNCNINMLFSNLGFLEELTDVIFCMNEICYIYNLHTVNNAANINNSMPHIVLTDKPKEVQNELAKNLLHIVQSDMALLTKDVSKIYRRKLCVQDKSFIQHLSDLYVTIIDIKNLFCDTETLNYIYDIKHEKFMEKNI